MSAADDQIRRRLFVMERAGAQAVRFRFDFVPWLERNFPVWERFEAIADDVYKRRAHYSARTIGEYIRHETAMAEVEPSDFKINNNRFPDLARLYLILKPERDGFFELREQGERAAAA